MLVGQLMHAHSGVEKGMKKGGKPIEIMGMMVGRIDTDNENTVLVTDVRHAAVSRRPPHSRQAAAVHVCLRWPVRHRLLHCLSKAPKRLCWRVRLRWTTS